MAGDVENILFLIVKSVLCNSHMEEKDKIRVTENSLAEVVKLAQKHDVAPIVALGILNNGFVDEKIKERFQQIAFSAAYRYEKLNYELIKICEALEKAGIPFIPLKGSVLRDYYPEPWLRTSCDIDVLVSAKNLDKAVAFLVDNLNYTKGKRGSHDVSLFSPRGICLELHFILVEKMCANAAETILKDIWDFVKCKNGYKYWYEMPDDMFYFYHIAHMAKHIKVGGCGIRPFIDLFILDNMENVDVKKRDVLLAEGGLLKFANTARQLSRTWIDEEDLNPVTQKLEEYIMNGGVFGSLENSVKVQRVKKGGKFRFFMSRAIIPKEKLEKIYPILKKHRWLLPIMHIVRWGKISIRGISNRTKEELKNNWGISSEQAKEMKIFLEEIGL